MRRSLFGLICMLIATAFFLGCGNQSSPTQTISPTQQSMTIQTPVGKEPYGKNLYRNKENHFSIVFPDNWTQSGGRGPNVIVVSSNQSGDSMNVLIRDLPDNVKNYTTEQLTETDINDIVSTNYNAMRNVYPDASLDGKGITYINNRKAIWMKITATYRNPQSTYQLSNLVYIIWNKGKLYQIACASPPQKFLSLQSVFKNAVGSFVFEDGMY